MKGNISKAKGGGTVTSEKLADGAVTTSKVADKAITGAKIADSAITSSKLAYNSVPSTKIVGPIAVAKGGTGKTSWVANGLPYPSSSTAFTQLAFPTEESVLCQKATGAPYWTALSALGSGGGGFKKIGFTDDCDYKVSASNGGAAAFQTAINAAASGDTILVMPGVYSYSSDSSSQLTVKKDLTFIGIGMPTVKFGITIYANMVSDDVGNVTSQESYATSWCGFTFKGSFGADASDGPGVCAQSFANATGCVMDCGLGHSFSPSGNYENCSIICEASISCGGYYGTGNSYVNCKVSCVDFAGTQALENYSNCDITLTKDTFSSGSYWHYGGASLDRCNLYICGTGSFCTDSVHGGTEAFTNCRIFKNSGLTLEGSYTSDGTMIFNSGT